MTKSEHSARRAFYLGGDSLRSGFSLTITLILVTLAAIIVVAFITTSTSERTAASAYARIEKARLFAEGGVDAAISRVLAEMTARPYSAIGYRSAIVDGVTEFVPVITGPRIDPANPSAPTYNSPPASGGDVFLISIANSTSTPPGSGTASAPNGSIDLNNNHSIVEPRGWIGSPTTTTGIQPYQAPWIDILRDPTKAPQPDPTITATYNPVIGRYAYWIEDETSKLDTTMVGNQEVAPGAFKRGNRVDVLPKVAVNDLDIRALPLASASPLPVGDVQPNKSILDLRNLLPMIDSRFLNRVSGLTADVHETVKFYATTFGLSNELAGNGRRRANINSLVTNGTDAGQIAGNLDDIAYVLSGKHLLARGLGPAPNPDNRVYKNAPDNFQNAMVDFGKRFFYLPSTDSTQQTIYLERVAANIRDYIDTDQQPTYVSAAGTVIAGSPPTLAWKSGSEPQALGKEAIPYLQELAWHGFEREMSGTGTNRNYNVDIDMYFEFLNPTTKDFVAPAGAFIKVYSRLTWDAGTFPPLVPPDFTMDISGKLFPAGQATIVTNAPNAAADPPGLLLSTRVIRIPGPTTERNFSGTTNKIVSGTTVGLKLLGRSGTSGVTDYSTGDDIRQPPWRL